MPLIFSELALTFPPERVSDPSSTVAAANGQFLMVQRGVYFQLGGHSAVAGSLLEDVDLARLMKRRKYPIRFRYAPDALSTRMYRSFGAMIEGWTKNLARLFTYPLVTAASRALDAAPDHWSAGCWCGSFSHVFSLPCLGSCLAKGRCGDFMRGWRSRTFRLPTALFRLFAVPLFCLLLVRSWWRYTVRSEVGWKGRVYSSSSMIQNHGSFNLQIIKEIALEAAYSLMLEPL